MNFPARWSSRALILDFQDMMFKYIPEDQREELPVVHHFVRKCYIRECFLRKDILVVGKIHKYETFNIILKGDVTVFSEEFGIVRYQAPLTFISKPGAKRVVYANEDTTWLTVHPTESRDLADIEEEFIAKDYQDPLLLGTLKEVSALEES